jgi:type II secretory pathway pseudopilin PulG
MMSKKRGKSGKGITLIELVIILFFIGILSAAAIPYMRGRSDASKWAEGKAIAGSIRTAADVYRKGKDKNFDFSGTTLKDLGFTVNPNQPGGDLDGKFFSDDCFSIEFSKNGDYLITVNATKSTSGDAPSTPQQMTFDSAGVFLEVP